MDMGEFAPLPNQQQFRFPAQVGVPMEEREARANRFASLQEEGMENAKLQQSNSKLRLLRVARTRVLNLRSLLDSAEVELARLQQEYSDQQNSQT